jgi:hypothetical protein
MTSTPCAMATAAAACVDSDLTQLERPVLTCAEAGELVAAHWGLRVLSVSELGSYEDRNFLVTGVCLARLDPWSAFPNTYASHANHLAALASSDPPACCAAATWCSQHTEQEEEGGCHQQQQQQQQQRVLKVTNAVSSAVPGFLEVRAERVCMRGATACWLSCAYTTPTNQACNVCVCVCAGPECPVWPPGCPRPALARGRGNCRRQQADCVAAAARRHARRASPAQV